MYERKKAETANGYMKAARLPSCILIRTRASDYSEVRDTNRPQ